MREDWDEKRRADSVSCWFAGFAAHLLLKLGRNEAANWAWELLLEENPDSYEFIKGSVLAKGADCGTSNE